ncbi:uncharacterized protein LACBIDRAFT_304804 [Laccaria bicolor S238N-H82]|uniref:Predicted protein n=1 Tax=Laccaria bicolor (strain S238N-H82 / ATCC MYA-4686) TaxID=486041 RepID=B0DMD7_LACBS|nr:uncharacterized protein LACBIDRAFT_304804 [Laccaria bicolor S238N-H82]EDR04174.1 predicted protein [Laccaria bicolor S238N-H82]|eukprot:XP_001885065.1 predicted protein [Laccaria bicolor S238N-H82]
MRRFFFKLELLRQSSSSGTGENRSSRIYPSVLRSLPQDEMINVNPFPAVSSATLSSDCASTSHSHPASQTQSQRACLAIQQHDQPFDAIVISTLPSYPFCCHEDLLTMSRAQLIGVAQLLNSRIPPVTRLRVEEDVSDADIRAWVEVLVGIKLSVPGAPKAVRCRPLVTNGEEDNETFDFDAHVDAMPSPPTSPLSMRISRRQEKLLPLLSSPPRPLECLDEAEENIFTSKRPLKRRKTQDATVQPDDVSMSLTPPPPPSSHRTSRPLDGSPTPRRVLRSHSSKLAKAANNIDASFVNTKPRYRSASRSAKNIKGKDSTSMRRSITVPTATNFAQYRPQDSSFLSAESRSRASSSSALSVASIESTDSGSILDCDEGGKSKDERQTSIVAGMMSMQGRLD